MDQTLLSKISELNEIQRKMDLLEAEKNQIREQIGVLMLSDGKRIYSFETKEIVYLLKFQQQEKIQYNEEILKGRLGGQYKSILVPDSNKIRKNLGEVIKHLDPIMERVGKVSRERVKEQIRLGTIRADDFKGAFTKEVKNVLYVIQKERV